MLESPSMRACVCVLVVGLVASACGAGAVGGGSRSKTQCPDSQTSCLSAPACAWDDARSCEVCHCSPPSAPPDYTPQGPPSM